MKRIKKRKKQTTRDLVVVNKIVRDRAFFTTRGIREASAFGAAAQRAAISAYKRGLDPTPFVVDGLLRSMETVRDGMVVAHLFGQRRAKLLLPQENPLSLSTFDKAKAFATRRLGISEVELLDLERRYGAEALRILRKAARTAEIKVAEVLRDLLSKGAHVAEGVEALNEAFQSLGIAARRSHQLEAIFRTQTQLAFSAGRWEVEQQPEIQEILWGYKYVTVGDTRVRDSHRELDGVTLPKDDPFWETNYPPNGYNCRCDVIPVYRERKIVPVPTSYEGADDGFRFNPGKVVGTLNI